MSHKVFTEEQINRLKNHPCIEHISDKAITYTQLFKEIAVEAYNSGQTPRMIFEANGLSVQDLGKRRIKSALYRWRKLALREEGLRDTRSTNTIGRPRTRPRTPEEELIYLRDKVEYLEQENEFLKKLKDLERKVLLKSKPKTNTK